MQMVARTFEAKRYLKCVRVNHLSNFVRRNHPTVNDHGHISDNGVASKVLTVAIGNERLYTFYERYGFFPREVILKQKVDVD